MTFSLPSDSDPADRSKPILTVARLEGDLEIRTNEDGTVLVSTEESSTRLQESRSFATLSDAVVALQALAFNSDRSPVEVTLFPDSGLTVDELIQLADTSNDDFGGTASQLGVLQEPQITVNDRRFFAVTFDDGPWKLVEDADDCDIIARISMFEPGPRTAGSFTFALQRLSTGEVMETFDPDGEEGFAVAISEVISDVEAVRRWIRVSEGDIAADVLIPAYRDGQKIEVGSDFNPELADTLEVNHQLNLTDNEKQELWLLLDANNGGAD